MFLLYNASSKFFAHFFPSWIVCLFIMICRGSLFKNSSKLTQLISEMKTQVYRLPISTTNTLSSVLLPLMASFLSWSMLCGPQLGGHVLISIPQRIKWGQGCSLVPHFTHHRWANDIRGRLGRAFSGHQLAFWKFSSL